MNGNGNGNVIKHTLTHRKRTEEDSSFSIFSCVTAIKSTNKPVNQPTNQGYMHTHIHQKTVAKWREVVLFARVCLLCVWAWISSSCTFTIHKKASYSHLSTPYIFITWVQYFIWQFHALLHSCSLYTGPSNLPPTHTHPAYTSAD